MRSADVLRRLALSLLALGIGVAPGCDSVTPDHEVWRFAIEETRGSVQDAYARRFAELVEERSDGDVRVVVYPYGAVGTSDQITEQVHNGTIDFAFASPGHVGKLIPEVQVFLLHYVLSDDEEVNKLALRDPELLRALDRIYGEKGFELLSVVSEGWMAWTTNEEIRTPEDFEGIKFRVMTSPLLLALYSAYGASPTPLPYSEVYSGLQLHMIDGQVNPVFAIQEMSFYEVTDYMIFPKHAQFYTTLMASSEMFESLSEERRTMIQEIVTQLHDENFEVQQRFNRERLEIIRTERPEMQIYELSSSERAAFRARSLPVRDQYVEMTGPRGAELLQVLEGSVRRAEEQLGRQRDGSPEPNREEER